MDNATGQTPAQVTCAHCQRSSESASAPHPFLLHPATPKCPREPTILQPISIPSTPCRNLFWLPRFPVQAVSAVPFCGPRILQRTSNSSTAFETAFNTPRFVQHMHLSGARIVQMHMQNGKGLTGNIFQFVCGADEFGVLPIES